MKSIVASHIEVLEELACVEWSCLYALDMMLLHHSKSVVAAHVEVLEELARVECSHLYALDTMLLHHSPLDKNSWTPVHELLY